MMIFKFIRWLYKTLNGTQQPWQIGLGLALGFWTGLLPFSALTFLFVLAILFVNAHVGSALFGIVLAVIFQSLLGDALLHPIGESLLNAGPHGLFTGFATSDALSFLRLHESRMIGGLVMGLVLFAPLMYLIKEFVVWFRGRFYEKIGNNKFFKTLANTWLIKGLRFVFLG